MSKKLLLADDSVTIQRVIELTFADEDIRVISVSDGDQAVHRIETELPDIVLADATMPGRDGYEVSAFVKRTPELAHIPVLLLTGAFEPVDDARAKDAACDGILSKPFEPQAVINRVRDLLAQSPGASDDAVATASSGPDAHLATSADQPPGAVPTITPVGTVLPGDVTPGSVRASGRDDPLDQYFDRLDAAFAGLGPAAAGPLGDSVGPAGVAGQAEPAPEGPWSSEPPEPEGMSVDEERLRDLLRPTAQPEGEGSSTADSIEQSSVSPDAAASLVGQPPVGVEAAPVTEDPFAMEPSPESPAASPAAAEPLADQPSVSFGVAPIAEDPFATEPPPASPATPPVAAEPLADQPPVSFGVAPVAEDPFAMEPWPASPATPPMAAKPLASQLPTSVEAPLPAEDPFARESPPADPATPSAAVEPLASQPPVSPEAPPAVEDPFAPSVSSVLPPAVESAVSVTPPTAAAGVSSAVMTAAQPSPGASLADRFAALLTAEEAGPVAPTPSAAAAEVSAATAGAQTVSSDLATDAIPVSDDLIEQVARRVIERMSDRVFREIAGDVVLRVADRLVREEIERIKRSVPEQ